MLMQKLSESLPTRYCTLMTDCKLRKALCINEYAGEDCPSQTILRLCSVLIAGEEVVLEYHHPEPFPPEGTFVARIASVLQVRAPAVI